MTFILAFIIAGVCAFLVYRLIRGQMTATKPVVTTGVVAAAQNIKLGTIVSAKMLTTAQLRGTPPKGSILEKDKKSVIGRGVTSDIYQGEPIMEQRLAPAGSGGGLAATIPTGMRASAVKVDQVIGMAGFVIPGMRVDVIASGTPPGSHPASEGTVAKTVLQDIKVLSAGTDIQKNAEGKPKQVQVVSLLVTPKQAQTLNLASQQNAKIQLVLRNPTDTKIDKVPITTMGELFSGSGYTGRRRVRRIIRRAPAPYEIEVINGSHRSVTKIASSEGQR